LLKTYEKLGIPLKEQELSWREPSVDEGAKRRRGRRLRQRLGGDDVQEELAKAGVIFCSISEACVNILNW
jgi:Fe-S cluster assembly protein SufB